MEKNNEKRSLNAFEISEKVVELFNKYIGQDPFRFRTVEGILSKDGWATNYLEHFVRERDNKANKEVCSHLLLIKVVTEPDYYDEADNSCPNCRKAIDLLRELFHAIKYHNRAEERQTITDINTICPDTERHGNTDAIISLLQYSIEKDK